MSAAKDGAGAAAPGPTRALGDVGKSIAAARRKSVEVRRSVDGRRSIDMVTIPHHDYQRGSDSSEEEAELNNENLPKSSSTDSFEQDVGVGGRTAVLSEADEEEALAEGTEGEGNVWRSSTEENNLISEMQDAPVLPNASSEELRRLVERRSVERRSGESRLSVDGRCSRDRRMSGSSVRTSTESAEGAKIRSLAHSTLYLGNLHPYVNDVVLRGLFSGFDGIVELKVIKDRATGLSAGYGFARFSDVGHATLALEHIKSQIIFGQQIKANWALHKDKEDELGSHHHVFVGDLSPDVRDDALKAAFAHLEGCSDARVMWDHGTRRSKGYGFVSFVGRDQADRAIKDMDGVQIGTRRVRCGWAKHKTDAAVPADPNVLDQTDPTNTNIYIGNLPGDLSNEEAREEFSKYGTVVEIKLHRKGNYGFVRYQTHGEAVQAIVCLNDGHSFGGRKLKCSWGRHPMVPPSGVKAQLIMAAASSGQLAQPSMIPHMHASYLQTTPGQAYNMNLNSGGAAPGLVPNRQLSPMYAMGQMAQLDGGRMGGPLMGGIDAVAEGMARMGFYGNQMTMPQSHNPDVNHAMSSGFYRSGSFGQPAGPSVHGGFPDSRRRQGGGSRGRPDGRPDGRSEG